MKHTAAYIVVALAPRVLAQNGPDLFSSLLSDAGSIFTLVTSVLGNTATSASTSMSITASSTISNSSPSSSFSSSPTSTNVSSSSLSNSVTTSSTPTVAPASSSASSAANAAQSTGTAAAATNNQGGGSNTLAIVLGCTLGALALAALLGLLFLCMRRRRKSKSARHSRALSANDAEVDSWRHEKSHATAFKTPEHSVAPMISGHTNTPLMTGLNHDYHANDASSNPFVPVPPPARRSSRHGMEDTSYTAHPYSADHVNGYHNDHESFAADHNKNHHGQAIGAGTGGMALGVLAAHARHRRERSRSSNGTRRVHDRAFSEDEANALPQAAMAPRRSGDASRANVKEPWPYTNTDGTRPSTDSAHSRTRSLGKSQEDFATPNQYPSENENMPHGAGILAAAGAGAVGGAALANHRNNRRSPHRKGILKQTVSDSSDPASSSGASRADGTYGDNLLAHNSGPHELATADVPITPRARGRPTSGLGTAAPLAAIGAVGMAQARRQSGSPAKRSSLGSTGVKATRNLHATAHVPSQSPHRTSLDATRYDHAHDANYDTPQVALGGTGFGSDSHHHHGQSEVGTGVPLRSAVSPPLEAERRDPDGMRSPVSPITNSNPGTWSQAQAEELGLEHIPEQRLPSQESTIVNTPPMKGESDTSDSQSSGLVSAIQHVFSSQKNSWASENDYKGFQPLRRSEADGIAAENNPRYDHVPRRKPAPARASVQPYSHYGEIESPYSSGQTGHDARRSLPSFSDRHSGDHGRSEPPHYRSRANSNGDYTAVTDFASMSTDSGTRNERPKPRSRPGYGIGSGDPFDLARTRTDSSMTGVSLSNYQEPAPLPSSSILNAPTSGIYREPTLAELRTQVQAEDRQYARKSLEAKHRRSGSSGLRYGDDRELFNLIDETTGAGEYHGDPTRYYARAQGRATRDVGRAM